MDRSYVRHILLIIHEVRKISVLRHFSRRRLADKMHNVYPDDVDILVKTSIGDDHTATYSSQKVCYRERLEFLKCLN